MRLKQDIDQTKGNHAGGSINFINAIDDNALIVLLSLDHLIICFNQKAFQDLKSSHRVELKVGEKFMRESFNGAKKLFKNFEENFSRAVKSTAIVTISYQSKSDDTKQWLECHYFPMLEHECVTGVAIVLVNTGERKQWSRLVERQNEALKNISWIQSHRTRQPVASILGLISILDKTTLSESNLEIINMIEAETKKLDDIIHETVALANFKKTL